MLLRTSFSLSRRVLLRFPPRLLFLSFNRLSPDLRLDLEEDAEESEDKLREREREWERDGSLRLLLFGWDCADLVSSLDAS